ncbi:MAG: hypothetical protein M8349_03900, partial [ANME-2 cluster archaeon]|nr:hypothetical protein [ANME-2 cluster archaeon]
MTPDNEEKDVESQRILTRWVYYLVQQFGKTELEILLNKYILMRWIDESIKESALKISETIHVAKSKNPQYNDHLGISYLFIQKLMGKYVDMDMLPPYDGEVDVTEGAKTVDVSSQAGNKGEDLVNVPKDEALEELDSFFSSFKKSSSVSHDITPSGQALEPDFGSESSSTESA